MKSERSHPPTNSPPSPSVPPRADCPKLYMQNSSLLPSHSSARAKKQGSQIKEQMRVLVNGVNTKILPNRLIPIISYYHIIPLQQDCIIQFKFAPMLASIKKSGFKMKNSVVKAAAVSKRWIKRYRKRIIITLLILLAIGLAIGLVLAAFQGVEITNYGVVINYTQQRIHEGTANNQVHFIGINSRYFLVPKRKFLIYFEEESPFEGAYWAPKLTARSQQGTKMIVSARVSCSIRLPSAQIKTFLEDYGLDWQNYVIQKSRNTIIQNIGSTAFYEMNNTLLLKKINSQFWAYGNNIANYPFNLKLISLKREYPADSYSSSNSLGIKLLQEKSLYSQLTSGYQYLNAKIANSISEINQISARIGTTEAAIRMTQMQLQSLDSNWVVGLEILNRLFNGDNTQTRRFMWLYFQKLYNSTYNNYTFY